MSEEEKKMVDDPLENVSETSQPVAEHSKGKAMASSSSPPSRNSSRSKKQSPYYDYHLDTRDEEEGEDPYVYSDDSASLSDAYFLPQSDDDLARPPRYREEDPLKPNSNQVYPFAAYYGSLNGSSGSNHHHHDRSKSPLWAEGAIQEDSELVPPPVVMTACSAQQQQQPKRGERSKQRQRMKQQRMMHLKQLERTTRERAVAQVRGKPQDGARWNDPIFAIIFVVQLLAIIACAVHFGSILLKENAQVFRAIFPSSPTGSFHWERSSSGGGGGSSESKHAMLVVQLSSSSSSANSGKTTREAPPASLIPEGSLSSALVEKEGEEKPTNATMPGKSIERSGEDTKHVQTNSSGATKYPLPSHSTIGKGEGTTTTSTTTNTSAITLSPTVTPVHEDAGEEKIKANPTSFAFTIDYKNIIALVSVAGFYACVLTYLSFGFMLILARALIQIMLVFSVLLALAWGTIGLTLDPYGVIAIMGFACLLLTLGYTIASWNRIPFAATNLYTALCAMRCTADITILGLTSLLVAFAWCVVWTMAFVGIVNSFNSAECTKKDVCEPHFTSGHIPLYLVLLFSFHWTNTVIKNVVRVTVASAIGTWWFTPHEVGPFCTRAVLKPLFLSLTKYLGSICYGSLVVQPARFISSTSQCCCFAVGCHDGSCVSSIEPPGKASKKNLVSGGEVADGDEDERSAFETVGACRRLCVLHDRCRSFLRSCNRWSYTYIGMYGYAFREAGERALQLFETREWVDVVKDNLVQNVLLMASLIIGGSTGTFAVIVEETDGLDFTSFHKPIISAFLVGSVIGYVLSNILLLGVVASAVNTVLVCFAAGPFEFDKNHPLLSREMREAWSHHVWEA